MKRRAFNEDLSSTVSKLAGGMIARKVGKEMATHAGVETAKGSAEGSHGAMDKFKSGDYTGAAKEVVKGVADAVVPGSVDAYRDVKKGDYGSAASKIGQGATEFAIGSATRGISGIMKPTPAKAATFYGSEAERNVTAAAKDRANLGTMKEGTKMDTKEIISEALDNILENNLSAMKDNLFTALQEKTMEKLEEKKKIISANYFAQ